jgi:hypothetical protein
MFAGAPVTSSINDTAIVTRGTLVRQANDAHSNLITHSAPKNLGD